MFVGEAWFLLIICLPELSIESYRFEKSWATPPFTPFRWARDAEIGDKLTFCSQYFLIGFSSALYCSYLPSLATGRCILFLLAAFWLLTDLIWNIGALTNCSSLITGALITALSLFLLLTSAYRFLRFPEIETGLLVRFALYAWFSYSFRSFLDSFKKMDKLVSFIGLDCFSFLLTLLIWDTILAVLSVSSLSTSRLLSWKDKLLSILTFLSAATSESFFVFVKLCSWSLGEDIYFYIPVCLSCTV